MRGDPQILFHILKANELGIWIHAWFWPIGCCDVIILASELYFFFIIIFHWWRHDFLRSIEVISLSGDQYVLSLHVFTWNWIIFASNNCIFCVRVCAFMFINATMDTHVTVDKQLWTFNYGHTSEKLPCNRGQTTVDWEPPIGRKSHRQHVQNRGGSSFFPRGGFDLTSTSREAASRFFFVAILMSKPRIAASRFFLLFWTPVSDVFLASILTQWRP